MSDTDREIELGSFDSVFVNFLSLTMGNDLMSKYFKSSKSLCYLIIYCTDLPT